MSFRDLENNEQVFLSQDMQNESFSQMSQEQEVEQQQQENYPQFNQNSNILSEINTQPKLQTKKSILLPQTVGLFSLLLDNQSRIYDIFQNFFHRLFHYYFLKKVMGQNVIQNYIDLQAIKRKLTYISQVYNQTFGALKNCIQNYQEKLILMTSEQDKEDPYSLLTQHEIDLRRGLHDFYQFIDSEDLLASSKGMAGSQNMQICFQYSSQYKLIQIEVFNPADLTTPDRIAQFLLNSLEMEEIPLTTADLLNDEISLNLIKMIQQLLQIWLHLFRFLNQYDVTNIQFNYEVDQNDHNAAVVAAQTLFLVPQDIGSKVLKGQNKDLKNYHLNVNTSLPLKEEYAKKRAEKNQPKLQGTVHFDKSENVIKIGDDALTNDAENFSFSNAEHSINEEQSDQQQTLQKFKQQLSTEQFSGEKQIKEMQMNRKQAILDQAVELSFKGKINENHLLDILPPKHRAYIAESSQLIRKVTPIGIKTLDSNPKIEFNHCNYFFEQEHAFLHYFKPFTKTMYHWQLYSDDVQKIDVDIEQQFGNELISFTSREGMLFLFNPFSNGPDDCFFKYNFHACSLQALPKMLEKRRNFRVAQIGHYIYVIGGENTQVLASCERFSLKSLEWQKIKSMQTPLTKVNLVVYQERYLIRFGGLNRFEHFDKTVEKYDTKKHKWYPLKVESEQDLMFKLNSVCLQVSFDQILSFGGMNSNGHSDPVIYVLRIEEKDRKKNESIAYVQKVNVQQQLLSFNGEYDINVYYQDDRIYFFRKDYSSVFY